MYCPNCGKENGEDSHFCIKCGQKLTQSVDDITPTYNEEDEFVDEGRKEDQTEPIAGQEHFYAEDDEDAITQPLEIPEDSYIDESIEKAKEKSRAKINQTTSAGKKKNKKKNQMIVIGSIVLAIIIIGVIAAVILLGGRDDSGIDPTVSEVTTTAEKTTTTKATTTTATPTTEDAREKIVKDSGGVFDYDGFVFADSDGTYLNENDRVELLKKAGSNAKMREYLGYARNEIYARHGQSFSGAYNTHYSTYSWYRNLSKREVSDSMLNDYEKDNIATIDEWLKNY